MEAQTEIAQTSEAPEQSISATETTTQGTQASEAPTEVYKPFSAGKEKFKVNGVEEEWDWETTKRYAQFGKAGRQAMDKAKQLEAKYKETYNKLVEFAQRDMEQGSTLLYQALTGKQVLPKAKAEPVTDPNSPNAPGQPDPRDERLRTLEEKLSAYEQKEEQRQIEEERKAVAAELDDAVKKFPALDTKFLREYVKSEYRKALVNGEQISIEDVAFFVAEELKTQEAQKSKAQNERIQQNIKQSPITTPAAPGNVKKKGTLEDAMRLGGVLPS